MRLSVYSSRPVVFEGLIGCDVPPVIRATEVELGNNAPFAEMLANNDQAIPKCYLDIIIAVCSRIMTVPYLLSLRVCVFSS